MNLQQHECNRQDAVSHQTGISMTWETDITVFNENFIWNEMKFNKYTEFKMEKISPILLPYVV